MTFEGVGFNEALLFRVEFHTEHVAYTFVLPIANVCDDEQPGARSVEKQAVSVDPNRRALAGAPHETTDKRVDELVLRVWREISRCNDEEEEHYKARVSAAWDMLYDEAWRIAFQDAPSVLRGAPVSAGGRKSGVGGPPGCVFCNFRSVYLPREWMIPAFGKEEHERHRNRKLNGNEQFIPTDLRGLPYVDDEPELLRKMRIEAAAEMGLPPPKTPRRWNRVSAGQTLARNSALRHALHWRAGVIENVDGDMLHFHRRTVANLVLEGSALFASAFASAPEVGALNGKNTLDRDPAETAVRSSVFYCDDHLDPHSELLHRRLDRLRLRLHSLGTLRLLALKDLDRLLEIQKVQDNLEAQIDSLNNGIGLSGDKFLRAISSIENALEIAQARCAGGLNHRVSKSVQYSNQYQRILNDFRIDRIDGWEPYDQFVSRRLFNQFENIRRIGERAAYIRSRLDRSVELVETKAAVDLTGVAVKIGAIGVALTVAAGMSGNAAANLVKKLAEWALVVVERCFSVEYKLEKRVVEDGITLFGAALGFVVVCSVLWVGLRPGVSKSRKRTNLHSRLE